MGISSTAVSEKDYWQNTPLTGSYILGFFGSEAQEIGGLVEFESVYKGYSNQTSGKKEIGFGGQRGEIKK